MAAPQALRSNYSDLFGTSMLPVLEEMFRSEYEQAPMQRDQLFKVVPHDRDIWQYSEMHDMPLFSGVTEGQDYTFSRPKAGNNKTLTVQKYGLGVSVTEELVDDGKFDILGDAIKKLGKSARESQEQAAMDIFNNGFTSETTADGLSLFNSAHTTPSGNITVRNKLSVDSDLSYSSLQTAIADFEKVFRGDSGVYNRIRPKFLLVHSDSRLYAKEIVGSEKKVDTNNNNLNSIKEEGLIVISSPRLTDLDAWFLIGDPVDTGLRIISRKPLETKMAGDAVGFMNDAIYYKARYREKIGATHHNGVFGTPGA